MTSTRFYRRGGRLDHGAPGSPAAASPRSSDPAPARSWLTTRSPRPPTSTAVASARKALPGWATATPADRSAVLAKLAEDVAGEHADDCGGRGGSRDRQPGCWPPSSTCRAASTTSTSSPARPAISRARPPPSTRATISPARGHRRGRDRTPSSSRYGGGVEVLPAFAAGYTVVIKPMRADPADHADSGPAAPARPGSRRGAQRRDRRRLGVGTARSWRHRRRRPGASPGRRPSAAG